MDPLPDFGSAEITVVPVPGNAPEDVVVDGEGQIWTGVDDGRITYRWMGQQNTLQLGSRPIAARRRSSATPAGDRSVCTWPATAGC